MSDIPEGINLTGIAFNSNSGLLNAENFGSNTISVIDLRTNTVVGTPIQVRISSRNIAFNPDSGFIYMVILASKIHLQVSICQLHVEGKRSPVLSGNRGNQGSNTISVIAPLTTTFSEGCNGTIGSGGQTGTCTITNTYGIPS